MAKLLAAAFAYVVIFCLLWPNTATAREATLAARAATSAAPMLSAESLKGEPIDITALEVKSVIVGPLIVTKLAVDLAPHPGTAKLHVRLPPGARVIEWDREYPCDGGMLRYSNAEEWSRELGYDQGSLIYAQPLLHGRAFVARLAGQQQPTRLDAALTDQDGNDLAQPLVLTDVTNATDIIVQVDGIAEAYRAGDFAMVSVHASGKPTSAPIRDAILLFDTSASSAQELAHRIEQARAIVRVAIGRLAWVTFDQSSEVVFRGTANDFSDSLLEAVARHGALGATSLEDAFSAISSLSRNREYKRVILFTDGLTTVGSRNRTVLSALVQQWGQLGIRRLDVVAPELGGNRELLEALVAAGLADRGRVVSNNDLVLQLEQAATREQQISVEEAIAQRPSLLSSPMPNAEHWVMARVPQGTPLRVRVGATAGKVFESQTTSRPLLERYFRFQQLLASNGGAEPPRLDLSHGELHFTPAAPRAYCFHRESDWTSGRMPPEAIQRIVRLNFGRFRGCATQNHRAPIVPKGRVTARFVIGNDGSVTSVTDVGSTVRDAAFVRCVLEAFTALRFAPSPDGPVTVVYPLVFVDGEEKQETTDAATRSYSDDIPKNYAPVKIGNPEYALSPRDVGFEAYTGAFRVVMEGIQKNKLDVAEATARGMLEKHPDAVVSYLAWGKVAEARGQLSEARRAYGSVLDRFDGNAPLLRVAAAWLAHLGDRASRALAAVALKKALELKEDRVKSERQLAWLYAEDGDYEAALELLTRAFVHQEHREPSPLNREISILAAAARARHPEHEAAIMAQLKLSGTQLSAAADLVVVLDYEAERWLELALYTNSSEHRFRATNAFAYDRYVAAYEIAPSERRVPYVVHVAGSGPGLGFVRIVDYDGERSIHVELRPFILQNPGSEVDLGLYPDAATQR